MTTERGFTLVELMVVISIMAILSVVGLVSYTNFLKSSRDSKRQSDLKFIQSALEDYHADQIYYPYSVTPGNSLSYGNKTYLNKIPNDPIANPNYLYTASGTNCTADTPKNCTSYCLYAKFEGTAPTSDPSCNPTPPYNYGLTRP